MLILEYKWSLFFWVTKLIKMITEKDLLNIGFEFVKEYKHGDDLQYLTKQYKRKNIMAEITYLYKNYHLFDFYIDEQYYIGNNLEKFALLVDILDSFETK